MIRNEYQTCPAMYVLFFGNAKLQKICNFLRKKYIMKHFLGRAEVFKYYSDLVKYIDEK